MRDRKLRVGLVGAGGIARSKHLTGWARVPFAEVLGLADVSAEALERAVQITPGAHTYHDWHELVARDDIDVIDVCTPNRTHAAIVLAALAAGKHVLCEKPLATSAEEVRAMRDAAASAGRLLMAAQHFRFDPVARQLKALIDAGTLGSVYYTRAQWLRRRSVPVATTFIERRLSGGGPVFDIGVHVLDLAYWFLGAPEPVSVSAFVDTKLAHDPQLSGSWGDWDHARYDVEDFTAGLVRFRDGGVLLLEASWLGFQPEKELTRLQCFGTRAGLVWPDGVVVGETNRVPWDMKLSEVPEQSPHHEEIMAFAVAVRDGMPSPVPVEESLSVVRILEAFYRSGQERREVPVE